MNKENCTCIYVITWHGALYFLQWYLVLTDFGLVIHHNLFLHLPINRKAITSLYKHSNDANAWAHQLINAHSTIFCRRRWSRRFYSLVIILGDKDVRLGETFWAGSGFGSQERNQVHYVSVLPPRSVPQLHGVHGETHPVHHTALLLAVRFPSYRRYCKSRYNSTTTALLYFMSIIFYTSNQEQWPIIRYRSIRNKLRLTYKNNNPILHLNVSFDRQIVLAFILFVNFMGQCNNTWPYLNK